MALANFQNPKNKLLAQFAKRAPATYSHSLLISKIAHLVAKKVSADYNKVKTQALYHDIGKMTHPYYFFENSGVKDIHTELGIKGAARVILAHVPDGVKICNEYGLPKWVGDGVREHHGKTQVAYFVKKAKEGGEKINLVDFSYKGPSPQSLETAILMLTDNIEASFRGKRKLSTGIIKEQALKVFNKRLKEGELANCGFSKSELNNVWEAITDEVIRAKMKPHKLTPKASSSSFKQGFFNRRAHNAKSFRSSDDYQGEGG